MSPEDGLLRRLRGSVIVILIRSFRPLQNHELKSASVSQELPRGNRESYLSQTRVSREQYLATPHTQGLSHT